MEPPIIPLEQNYPLLQLLNSLSASPFRTASVRPGNHFAFGGNPYMTPEELALLEQNERANVDASYVEVRLDFTGQVTVTELDKGPQPKLLYLYQGYPPDMEVLRVVLRTLQPFNRAHQ